MEMELVRQVPQKALDVAADSDGGQLRIRLEELDRAELLRRELHNLVSRHAVKEMSSDDWAAAVDNLLIEGENGGEKRGGADVLVQPSASEINDRGATATQGNKEPTAAAVGAEVEQQQQKSPSPPPAQGGADWIHLDRCKLLAREFL